MYVIDYLHDIDGNRKLSVGKAHNIDRNLEILDLLEIDQDKIVFTGQIADVDELRVVVYTREGYVDKIAEIVKRSDRSIFDMEEEIKKLCPAKYKRLQNVFDEWIVIEFICYEK